jgi:TNF receptor-associated protein 1
MLRARVVRAAARAATACLAGQPAPARRLAQAGVGQWGRSAGDGAAALPLRLRLPASFFSTSDSAPADEVRSELHEFQAETRQLLDIVTHSIYTDKEVFLRELISNASDAMEKLRHVQVMGEEVADAGMPLEIVITTDEKAMTLTIEDRGIGMTKDDMVNNLGTIARSGSKAFVNELKEKGGSNAGDAIRDIIGQFGLGFYSAFMVGDKVDVFSRSYAGGEATMWSSDGSGQYTVQQVPAGEQTRGCKIVVHLKEGSVEYAQQKRCVKLREGPLLQYIALPEAYSF